MESQQLTKQWQQANLEKSREMLKQQCLKCHEESLIASDQSIMAARDPDAPPLIPARWLAHGIYDHAAHRDVDCRYCHAQAYAAGNPELPGQDQNTVMISGIESCVGCHRPAETPTPNDLLVGSEPDPQFGGQSLWASDRCTMCHRYHRSGSAMPLASSNRTDAALVSTHLGSNTLHPPSGGSETSLRVSGEGSLGSSGQQPAASNPSPKPRSSASTLPREGEERLGDTNADAVGQGTAP
jgi:hypothetical protein